jgi:CheY-like chemotaxis protein
MSPYAPATIMIVDDDADIRDIVRAILEDEGYRVVEAINGRQALDLLQREPLPALILLDLGMPVMNGQEFRAAQRRDPRLSAIPVVVITAAGDSAAKTSTMQAKTVLPKPFRVEELMAAVAA